MLFEFFRWWYGPGWVFAWHECFSWVKSVQRTFSADVLFRTLFSPWKRIVSVPGRSLDEKFRAALDNLFSRVIGFFVRFFTLIGALIGILIAGIAGLVLAISWPAVPILMIYLLVRAVAG
jgi:hypothetical protein